MPERKKRDGTEEPEQMLRDVVSRQVERKRRARRGRPVWFSLGLMGLVGWSVALPALAGVALGLWLDHTWPSRVSWTITLLLVGVAIGCVNAWRWVKQEIRRD